MCPLALALTLAVVAAARAQNGFTGQVTASGAPVAGARVTLFTPNLSQFFETRSASDGRYTISGVPSMPYRLGVAKPSRGYQEIQVDTNGAIQMKNFALLPETHAGQWSVVGNTLPEFLDATDIAVLMANGKIFYCHDTVDPIVFDPATGIKTFPSGFWLPSGCMNGTLGATVLYGRQRRERVTRTFGLHWDRTLRSRSICLGRRPGFKLRKQWMRGHEEIVARTTWADIGSYVGS